MLPGTRFVLAARTVAPLVALLMGAVPVLALSSIAIAALTVARVLLGGILATAALFAPAILLATRLLACALVCTLTRSALPVAIAATAATASPLRRFLVSELIGKLRLVSTMSLPVVGVVAIPRSTLCLCARTAPVVLAFVADGNRFALASMAVV